MLRAIRMLLHFDDGGIRFDERYDFDDNLSAPISSPYTEGRGSLTLVQDDGDFATVDDYLVNTAQTTPAWGDLGAYTIAYTRESGRSLIAALNLETWEELGIGFNAAADPGNLTSIEHSFYAHATDGQFATETIGNIFDGLSLNTDYRVIEMLRAIGAWTLLDDGNTWQLIDVNDSGATTPLYMTYSILDGVGRLNTLRTDVVNANLRPNVVLSDNFSDTSAPFLSDGLGHLEADGVGSGLTRNGTNWSSASNKRSNDNTGGAELLTNGDFSAWTGDDPDGWTVTGEVASDPEVSEVGTGEGHGGVGSGMLNLFSSATTGEPKILQAILTTGKFYKEVTVVDTVVSGFILSGDTGGGGVKVINSTGTKTKVWRALSTAWRAFISSTVPTDITLASTSIVEVPIGELLDLVETGTLDVVARVNLTITDATVGGIAVAWDSVSSPQNGLIVYVDRAQAKIRVDKWLAGAFSSNLIDQALTYGAGQIMEVHLSDSDADGTYILRTYYNRGNKQETTFSDGDIIGNTIHGLFGLVEGGFAEKENVWAKDYLAQYDKFYAGAEAGSLPGFTTGFSLGFRSG